MRLRIIPDLTFEYDESIEYGNKIERMIQDLQKKINKFSIIVGRQIHTNLNVSAYLLLYKNSGQLYLKRCYND